MLSLLAAPAAFVAFALSTAGVTVLLAIVFVGVVVHVIVPLAVDPADSSGYRLVHRTYTGVVVFGALAVGLTLLVTALPVTLPAWVPVVLALVVGVLVALVVVRPGPRGRWDSHRLQVKRYRQWLRHDQSRLKKLTGDERATKLRATDKELSLDIDAAYESIDFALKMLSLAEEALDADRPDLFLTHYHAAKREVIRVESTLAELRHRLVTPSPPSGFAAIGEALEQRLLTTTRAMLGLPPDSDSSSTPPAPQPHAWLRNTARRMVAAAERDLDEDGANHVSALLTTDGEIRSDLTATDVSMAAVVLHDHAERTFTTLQTVERLLRLGTSLCVVGLVGLLLLALSGATAGVLVPLADASAATTLALVALFGFFGAVTSVLFALKDISADGLSDPELHLTVVNREFTFMRLIVGTLMGVVSYVVFTSGLLTAVLNPALTSGLTGSVFAALSLAFAAGFVERFVTTAVEEFAADLTAGPETDDSSSKQCTETR